MDSPDSPTIESRERRQPELRRFFYENPSALSVVLFCLFFTSFSLATLIIPDDRSWTAPTFVLHSFIEAACVTAAIVFCARRTYRKKLESGKVAP
jgi:hypothetical protein